MANKQIFYPESHSIPLQEGIDESLNDYVNALPKGVQIKGVKLLKKIFHLIKLNNDGQILYSDDEGKQVAGSSLIDLLSFLLGTKGKYRKPVDFEIFLGLLNEWGVISKTNTVWVNLYD